VPSRLTGAIDNSLSKWQDLFDLLHEHPHLWEPVQSATLLVKTEGRPRMAGEWALPYLAFINSAERELLRLGPITVSSPVLITRIPQVAEA